MPCSEKKFKKEKEGQGLREFVGRSASLAHHRQAACRTSFLWHGKYRGVAFRSACLSKRLKAKFFCHAVSRLFPFLHESRVKSFLRLPAFSPGWLVVYAAPLQLRARREITSSAAVVDRGPERFPTGFRSHAIY